MEKSEIRKAVLRAISSVAPEADLDALDPAANLGEELDLDSVDFLNVVVALNKDLGVEIPEADYAKLATLDAFVEYLAAKQGS